MLKNLLYYQVKPFLPWRLRMGLRRTLARRERQTCQEIWPINKAAAEPPDGWRGWPDGKKFAFVLTHDVEGREGLSKCRQLMQLEMKLGFRSSFNFIPEGDYIVPAELRAELAQNGFEVGVHDLKHDGKLYSSRQTFRKRAGRINQYLHEWNAVGFRSGFMHHNLAWLHDLDIRYDMSTFDTDPFEPQPDGVGTIYPFWVPGSNGDGYVEMPYTLPQDSTLFVLFREKTIDIWRKKLDWIAEKGGMALINVHPDYIDFTQETRAHNEYPAARIEGLLRHITDQFSGRYWNPLPHELANWYSEAHRRKPSARPDVSSDSSRSNRREPGPGSLKGKRAAVLLYSYYPSDPRPRRAAEAMVSAGMEVDLICLHEDAAESKREDIGGVNVIRLPLRKRRESKLTYILQYSTFLFSCATILVARIPKKRYDLVHVHNMPDFLVFSALVPKWFGAKVILDLHDPMPELMMSIYNLPKEHLFVKWLIRLEKQSIAFADLVLTPNKAFRELFISRQCPPEKIDIVMNSPQSEIFDPEKYRVSTPANSNGERPFKLMYHGLLVERHGLDTAIEAVVRLRSCIPSLEFHIYGARTYYMNKIDQMIRHHDLEDRVHYHGHKSQEQIAQAIMDIDLGIIPNRRSPFTEINLPTRVFEYLGMKKPVIAPNTKGIRDYFNATQLFFFEPDDASDLARVIRWSHEHPDETEEMVQRGREVYHRHTWSAERASFVNLVTGVISCCR